jgi:hypothetical protein
MIDLGGFDRVTMVAVCKKIKNLRQEFGFEFKVASHIEKEIRPSAKLSFLDYLLLSPCAATISLEGHQDRQTEKSRYAKTISQHRGTRHRAFSCDRSTVEQQSISSASVS